MSLWGEVVPQMPHISSHLQHFANECIWHTVPVHGWSSTWAPVNCALGPMSLMGQNLDDSRLSLHDNNIYFLFTTTTNIIVNFSQPAPFLLAICIKRWPVHGCAAKKG